MFLEINVYRLEVGFSYASGAARARPTHTVSMRALKGPHCRGVGEMGPRWSSGAQKCTMRHVGNEN